MHGEARFVEGNVRQKSLREIWSRADAFAYNRLFKEEQLAGSAAFVASRYLSRRL